MEELRRVRELAGLVRAKTEHIDRLTEVSRRLRTARFGDSVSDGPQYGFAEVLAELDEIRRELCLYLASYADAKRECLRRLDGMENPKHAEVLYRRYILAETWEQVAEGMDVTRQWALKLHERACLKFTQID